MKAFITARDLAGLGQYTQGSVVFVAGEDELPSLPANLRWSKKVPVVADAEGRQAYEALPFVSMLPGAPPKPTVAPKAGTEWKLIGVGTKMNPWLWIESPLPAPSPAPAAPESSMMNYVLYGAVGLLLLGAGWFAFKRS